MDKRVKELMPRYSVGERCSPRLAGLSHGVQKDYGCFDHKLTFTRHLTLFLTSTSILALKLILVTLTMRIAPYADGQRLEEQTNSVMSLLRIAINVRRNDDSVTPSVAGLLQRKRYCLGHKFLESEARRMCKGKDLSDCDAGESR